MADKPLPDDRAMLGILEKLKAYNAHKSQQTTKPPEAVGAPGGPGRAESDLQTIETWADDADDDGKAWGQRREQESNEQIRESDGWQDVVKRDEADAAEEADLRSKLDVKQAKELMKDKLDEHAKAMQALGDAGEKGFKGKAAATKQQVAEAKQFLDQRFEKGLDESAKRNAAMRQRNRKIAARMQTKGDEGRKWKQEYGDQPDKLPQGQRTEVEAALDNVAGAAGQMAGELQPHGARAAVHVENLKKVQAWATKLKPQVGSQGAALKAAKASAKSGVADARQTFNGVEAFLTSLEDEASENLEQFRRWTDENNARAKQWINSDSPKHRAWAQAWMKTQEG